MPKRQKRDQLFQAVRGILIKDWNPIDVNPNPPWHDQYDSYARTLCRFLEEGADAVRIASYLCQFERNSMGLSHVDVERNRRIAQSLRSLVQ